MSETKSEANKLGVTIMTETAASSSACSISVFQAAPGLMSRSFQTLTRRSFVHGLRTGWYVENLVVV